MVSAPPPRLRILLCLLYYVPHRTGLTMHVHRLATELARRGHAVTVLTARHSRDLPSDERHEDGVRVVRLFATLRISRGMVMPTYPWAAWRLIRQHDVVSIHTPMLEAALLALLSRLARRPLVITHHGDLVLPAGIANWLIAGVMFGLYRLAARQASRIMAYSADYAAHSSYLLPFRDKVVVNHPPIDMPPPGTERTAAWRQAWQRADGPLIGFPHRFVEEKRPDVAMAALEVVQRRYPTARLVFAGQFRIPYEQTWERLQTQVRSLGDHLAFVGPFESRQEMADFYAACDAVVLTSDTDCFGLATVEAMLSGTPVVTTDIRGARVPVLVTGMGRTAPRGDAQGIGDALVEVLAHPDRYRRPRAEIEAAFALSSSIASYEATFRASIARA